MRDGSVKHFYSLGEEEKLEGGSKTPESKTLESAFVEETQADEDTRSSGSTAECKGSKIITYPQLNKHLSSLEHLCNLANQSTRESGTSFEVATVATVGGACIILSEPVLCVKRKGTLVSLWNSSTAKGKIEEMLPKNTSIGPDLNIMTPRHIGSILGKGPLTLESLGETLADLKEENNKLNSEVQSLREDRGSVRSQSLGSVSGSETHELKSLRRRLMSLETKVSIERSQIANKLQEMEARENELEEREKALNRKERLNLLLGSTRVASARTRSPTMIHQISSPVDYFKGLPQPPGIFSPKGETENKRKNLRRPSSWK